MNKNIHTIQNLLLAVLSWNITLLHEDEIISIHLFYGNDNEDNNLYTVIDNPDAEFNKAFMDLLVYVKNNVGDELWNSILKSLPVSMRQLLRTFYKV